MGAGHAHVLYRESSSPVHRLPPEVKIAAMVLFTVAVVATPRAAYWAFGGYALLIVAVAALARVGPRWLLGRALIELPFVLFADADGRFLGGSSGLVDPRRFAAQLEEIARG